MPGYGCFTGTGWGGNDDDLILIRSHVQRKEMKCNSAYSSIIFSAFHSFYVSSQFFQSFIYVLITPVNLFYILNSAFTFGTQCCNEQCYTGTYIRAAHGNATQLLFSLQSYNNSTMRIT